MPTPDLSRTLAGTARRRPITLADDALVTMRPLDPAWPAPWLCEPTDPHVDLVAWADAHRPLIRGRLHEHGALLFRGFAIADVDTFQRAVNAAVGSPLPYTERSSPRTTVGANVFTSTDYPPEYPIFLHNEQSYNLIFPLRIAFCCLQPAAAGGATPIADTRRVLARLPTAVREAFARDGYALIRNYGLGAGLGWQEAFQTSVRDRVEDYCRDQGIAYEWRPDGGLRTRQVRPVIARHPETGELAWFNHLTFFHLSSLPSAVRDQVLAEFAEGDLPTHTCRADATPIDASTLDALHAAYEAETIHFTWERGDLLLLDNMLMAHGRAAYTPPRRVVVAMAEPWAWRDVAPAPGQEDGV
jgi:alpha-ketoglutarate-dependent taurine dioxygenase